MYRCKFHFIFWMKNLKSDEHLLLDWREIPIKYKFPSEHWIHKKIFYLFVLFQAVSTFTALKNWNLYLDEWIWNTKCIFFPYRCTHCKPSTETLFCRFYEIWSSCSFFDSLLIVSCINCSSNHDLFPSPSIFHWLWSSQHINAEEFWFPFHWQHSISKLFYKLKISAFLTTC